MSQAAAYTNVTYIGNGCRCGAHRLHRVYQFFWANPSASRKAAGQALKLSPGNVREALWELRRRDMARVCPECWTGQLVGGVCRCCGFEPFEPVLPADVMPDSQHPTNSLHPGNMLGSETDYQAVAKSYGFSNQGFVLKRKMDRQNETPLLDTVRSDVANSLDGGATPEITEEAGRLCIKEWREFNARYPRMSSSKLARRQLTENVLSRLRLLHPGLDVRVLGESHE